MKTRAALARTRPGAARPSVLRSAYRRTTAPRAGVRRRTASLGDSSVSAIVAAQHLVVACARLATGYAVCARSARESRVADVAESLASLHRAAADELAAIVAATGSSVPRSKSTCSERLRWEWLASTGRLMGGAPERLVLAECARIEDAVAPQLATLVAVAALAARTSELDHERLRHIVTLLERGRAASERLTVRPQPPAIAAALI